MQVKFWGTRGSLPRALDQEQLIGTVIKLVEDAQNAQLTTLEQFVKALKTMQLPKPYTFGGQTTCNEVSFAGKSIYIDSGSGIAKAGDEAYATGIREFNIFQTHMHWDHILGLPFFEPIYQHDVRIKIHHVHKTAPEFIKILFNGVNFPVTWEQLGATIEFVQMPLYQTLSINGIQVTPYALDHPGGSFGYHCKAGGSSLGIGVDGEYKRFTPQELGKDLPYYQNLDLLIFDGQYATGELRDKAGWGHCSPPKGVDLALREGIPNIVFTHHDPRRSDARSVDMFEQARQHLQQNLAAFQSAWQKRGQPSGPFLYNAYDGMHIELNQGKISVID